MAIPLQVTFRHLDPSPSAEQLIREKADKLERFDITGARVVVEAPHRSHNKGNHYKVTIDLTVPGAELVVDRSPTDHETHEDLHLAIREAFDHALRELEKRQEKRRNQARKVG